LPRIVLIALVLRLGFIFIGHTYRFRTNDADFSFGWEMGRIGRSLAAGQGFSNPFNGTTGATAWEPPLYPLLIGLVFKLFGIYSHASAIVLLALSSLFSALTCIPIFLIARRCFGEHVAAGSAWAWALLPDVMHWCTRIIWETSFSAFLLAVIFWLALTLEEREGWKPWAAFGALWGIVALTNTSLLAFLPAAGLWAWYRRWRAGKRSLGGVALASVIFFGCVGPWIARDHHVLGQWMFVRSNFGEELRLGNGPGADGSWMEFLHPTQNTLEMRRYQEMGEVAYVAERKREALKFIREDYGRFVWLDVKRFVYFWAGAPRPGHAAELELLKNSLFLASSVLAFWGLGRALRKRRRGAWLFLWLVALVPLVYYFTFAMARYRHPIEPELAILCVYLILEAQRRKRAGGESYREDPPVSKRAK
jgi:4-amino-4-deoxy-L-arabinose transferase-like glycosyltransferase